MNYIEKIVSDISRIKEMVEKWNGADNVTEIERNLVKDYLSRVYDKICRFRVDEKHEKTQSEALNVVQKPKQEKPVEKLPPEPVVEPVTEQVQVKQKQKIEKEKHELNNVNTVREHQATLGEKLQKTKRFLSDDFDEKDDVMMTPIENLSKGIGLNDKFLFSKELFDGNSQKFNSTINAINAMNSFEEAEEYINTNFSWSSSNNIAKHFMTLVRRRFLKSQ